MAKPRRWGRERNVIRWAPLRSCGMFVNSTCGGSQGLVTDKVLLSDRSVASYTSVTGSVFLSCMNEALNGHGERHWAA